MKKHFLLIPSLMATVFLLVSCGKNDVSCPSGQVAQNNTCVMVNNSYGYGYGYGQTGNQNYGNSCTSGTFNTQYGCLPQGSCPANQAYASQIRQCVPVINTSYGNGGYSNGCANGQVMTAYGCLSQGSCPMGMAYNPMYQSCVQATYSGTYNGGYMGGYNGGYYGGGYGGGCMNGYVYTSYGCLPMGNCQYGMGYFNGYCIR